MEEKNSPDDEDIANFIKTVANNCAHIIATKNPNFGFYTVFQINGRKYSITFGEEVGDFAYLKDN